MRSFMEILGFVIIALVFLLVIFISGAVNDRKMLRVYKDNLKRDYGSSNKREYKNEEFSHIDGYFKKHKADYHLESKISDGEVKDSLIYMENIFNDLKFGD